MSELDILNFTSVSFGASTLSQGLRLKARKLKINNPWSALLEEYDPTESTGILDIFSGEQLEHLTLLSTTYCPEILRSLTDQSNCTRLRFLCLDIQVKDTSVLIPFLVSCPEIETIDFTLRIPPSDSYGVPVPDTIPSYLQLPDSALGNLRSISGPADMIVAFVPGRPIQDVTIKCERGHCGLYVGRYAPLGPALACLSQSTLPIKNLVVEADASEKNLINVITSNLPDLSLLQLHLQNRQVPKQRLSDSITGRLLQIANEMDDDVEPIGYYSKFMWDFVRDIKYMLYPSLREVTLMAGEDEPGSEAFSWYKPPGGKWCLRQSRRR
ncbi:hypothetical protein JR316_0003989 [Psilocybe cubensis]|uniref:Uncharacterized protein n=1 Tax=Psilocybe cubensis TaxID=181762 RepID=A0ACB8HA39_PSICU|nr:hypothetical protein JR316_0003989 [Psilocybe cubensis]KAH9484507.1 hypothetical protein JR316_0003989 [Psilocybe cubensis]